MRGTPVLSIAFACASLLATACHGPRGRTPVAATAVSPPSSRIDLATAGLTPPPGLDVYYLVLLRRGPAWTASQTAESKRIFAGHMANIRRLGRAGKLVLAGPILDANGPGDLAGLFVFHVRRRAELDRLLASDPAIQAHRLVPEVRAWMAGAAIRTADEPTPPAKLAPHLTCLHDARHKEFDFWLGSWNVTTPDGKLAGRNQVEKDQYGCVVHEHWTGARGGTGESVNYIDPRTHEWVQLWTSANGAIIQLHGGLSHGAMHLSGVDVHPDGTSVPMRATWTPLGDGRVHQLIESSKDGGKTWSTWFDGLYSHPGAPAHRS